MSFLLLIHTAWWHLWHSVKGKTRGRENRSVGAWGGGWGEELMTEGNRRTFRYFTHTRFPVDSGFSLIVFPCVNIPGRGTWIWFSTICKCRSVHPRDNVKLTVLLYLPPLSYFLQNIMNIVIIILSRNICEVEMHLIIILCIQCDCMPCFSFWKAVIKLMMYLKISVLELRTWSI